MLFFFFQQLIKNIYTKKE